MKTDKYGVAKVYNNESLLDIIHRVTSQYRADRPFSPVIIMNIHYSKAMDSFFSKSNFKWMESLNES